MRFDARHGLISDRTLVLMNTDDLILLARARTMLGDGSARRIRERAGLRRSEVAAAAEVSIPALQRWETGVQSPRGEPALRYARVLAQLAAMATVSGPGGGGLHAA